MVNKRGRKTKHRAKKRSRHTSRKHRGGSKNKSNINPCPWPGSCNPHHLHSQNGGSKGGLPLGGNTQPWGGNMAAYPPGPIYKPSHNTDAKFYGHLSNPFLPDPKATKKALVGGKKHKKKRRTSKKKSNSKRKTRKNHRKKKRSGGVKIKIKKKAKKGAGISNFLASAVPGFSDVRDAYWGLEAGAKNLYNTTIGFPAVKSPSASVQPIGKNVDVVKPKMIPIPQELREGSSKASVYSPYKK